LPQEDYIRREIDRLGKVLAKALSDLLGLRSEGKLQEGIHSVNEVLQSELNIDIDLLVSLPEKELLLLLTQKGSTNSHLGLIADLLAESIGGSSASVDEQKLSRALLIYSFVSNNDLSYSMERHYKIEKIQAQLKELRK
jgi:hypothetical protein